MIRVLVAVCSFFVFVSPASAVLLDFAHLANVEGEASLSSGSVINVNGVFVQFNARGNAAYFSEGNKGLGVCASIDGNGQCYSEEGESIQSFDEGADDGLFLNFFQYGFGNVGRGNVSRSFNITDLEFRDQNGALIDSSNDGLVGIFTESILSNDFLVGSFSSFIAMAQAGDELFQNTSYVGFYHVDKNFFISSVSLSDVNIPAASIPLPAAAWFFLSGLAGLLFLPRK